MTIQAMENWTKVYTPDGHKGRLKVTRRERSLIDAKKLEFVTVEGTDGLHRMFRYDELLSYEACAVCEEDVNDCDCGRVY